MKGRDAGREGKLKKEEKGEQKEKGLTVTNGGTSHL